MKNVRTWTSGSGTVHAIAATGKDGHWQQALCGKVVSALGAKQIPGDYTPGARATCKTCRRVLNIGVVRWIE